MPTVERTWEARRVAGLGLLCCAFFVDVMSSTSVFTASPSIQEALDLSQTGLQWSITAATLPAGALLLVGGRLADLFGRRRMFATGLVGLVAASALAGAAPSSAVLIAARALQGVAGALLIPAALALVIGMAADEAERNRALAAWSAIGGAGATAGLLLGGLVTSGLGWQWVFFINVPLGLAMLAVCPLLVPEVPVAGESRRLDVPGTVSFTAGLALFIYGFSQAPVYGIVEWRTLGVALLGLGLLAVFARVESRSSHPIVPARLIRSRSVVAGNVALLVAGMTVDGLLFTLTEYTQQLRGLDAVQFGAVTAVMTVSSIAAAWVAERQVREHGTGPTSSAGLALSILTCVLIALTISLDWPLFVLIAVMPIFGFGISFGFVAGTVASLKNVAGDDAGVAAAVQNISFSAGATLGVALQSTVAVTVAHSSGLTAGFRAAAIAGAVVAAIGLMFVGSR